MDEESISVLVRWCWRRSNESVSKLVKQKSHGRESCQIVCLESAVSHGSSTEPDAMDLENSANDAPVQVPLLMELLLHPGGNLREQGSAFRSATCLTGTTLERLNVSATNKANCHFIGRRSHRNEIHQRPDDMDWARKARRLHSLVVLLSNVRFGRWRRMFEFLVPRW
jgi:hypothetical protein